MTRPSMDSTQATQAGLKAAELYEAHRDALAPRLPPGMGDGLITNLTVLGIAVPAAQTAHASAQTATAEQRGAVRNARALISAVRRNITRRGAGPGVRAAYGVNDRRNLGTVPNAIAAIELIVQRASQHPQEAAELGILGKDVQALTEAHAALTSADARQAQLRAAAPTATRQRNAIVRQIFVAIDAIGGAGIVEFAQDPELRARFEALLGAGRRRRRRASA